MLSVDAIQFTVDTKLADVDGPIAIGVAAELIDPFLERVLRE